MTFGISIIFPPDGPLLQNPEPRFEERTIILII